jgi:hypothetical protein
MAIPARTITFALAGALILGLSWPLLHPSDAAVHRIVLQRQFKALKAPAEAKLIYVDEKPKLGRVFIGAYYKSSMTFEQLQNHYVPQWKRNGWTPASTRPVHGNATAQHLTLCKGDYQADLEDAGEKQNIGWTYAVTFSWGAQQQCPPSS